MRSERFAAMAGALLGAAIFCGVALAATDDAPATKLGERLDAIATDFEILRGEVTAANLAADPAVRGRSPRRTEPWRA